MAVVFGMDPNSFWSGLGTAAVIVLIFHIVWRCLLDDRDTFTLTPNEIVGLELDRDQHDEECRLTSPYIAEVEPYSPHPSSLSLSSSGTPHEGGAKIGRESADLELVDIEEHDRVDTEGSHNPLQGAGEEQ